MEKIIVKDYEICADIPPYEGTITGTSVALKNIVHHAFPDNTPRKSVLDIGFGRGHLGQLIRETPQTAHWAIDGIDGFQRTCSNIPLFQKKLYRNIWHGLAQDLGAARLASYDLLCLFDVIEHLEVADARKLLQTLLSSLGDNARLIVSTPLWFMPQDNDTAGDLEEHKFGVAAQSMLLLQPLMYHIDPNFLVGTFVYQKSSAGMMAHFTPTTDKAFNFSAGWKHLESLGRHADGVLYKIQ